MDEGMVKWLEERQELGEGTARTKRRPWNSGNMDVFQITDDGPKWMPGIGIGHIEWQPDTPMFVCTYCGSEQIIGEACPSCGARVTSQYAQLQLGCADVMFYGRMPDAFLTLFRMNPGDVCEILNIDFGLRSEYCGHNGGLRLTIKAIKDRWLDNVTATHPGNVEVLVVNQTVECAVDLLLPSWAEEIINEQT